MREDDVVAGWHAVNAALEHAAGEVRTIWLRAGREDRRAAELRRHAEAVGVHVREVNTETLDRRAGGLRHQGVIALRAVTPERDEPALWSLLEGLDHTPLLLVLDQVQDPHNLGACLRSADATGVDAVIVPRDRAVGLTDAVRRTAAGAAETVPFVRVTNLARCLRGLRDRGVWLTGLAGEAEGDLYAIDLAAPTALVLGAEERGLRRLTREHCDFLARLPMHGSVASLNVSAAAAVCLYEALRQRAMV